MENGSVYQLILIFVDRSEWPFTRQGSFTLGKRAPVLFERENDAVQNRAGQFGIEKYLVALRGNRLTNPRSFSNYPIPFINYAIPAP